MKKRLLVFGIITLGLALGVSGWGRALDAEVSLAPLGRSYSPPPLGRRQGWLTISNRDWQDYTLVVEGRDSIYLYRMGQGYGGIVIPSGSTYTIALEKARYDLYGNNSDGLRVKIREGRTTTLSLEPFGYVGQSGLMGVVNDGDKVRREVLFENYAPPVVIQPAPPPIIIERPPPPPPIIITRPPVIVDRRPYYYDYPGYRHPGHRHPGYRPPPPPPPPHWPDHRDSGWGFSFGFGSNR